MVLGAADAGAQTSSTIHKSPHLEHSSWIAGVRVVQFDTFETDERVSGLGPGLSLERNVINGWLEVEIALAAIRHEGAWTVPVDFIFKKPFHFGALCPYVGIGLAGSMKTHGETEFHLGASSILGTYWWLTDVVGIDLEIEYNLIPEDGLVQEVVVAIGPAFRF